MQEINAMLKCGICVFIRKPITVILTSFRSLPMDLYLIVCQLYGKTTQVEIRAVQQRPINRYSVFSFSTRSVDSLTDYSGGVKLIDYSGGVKFFDYPGVVKCYDYLICRLLRFFGCSHADCLVSVKKIRLLGAPRGYGEQGNLLFLLMGTWEHEQIFQGKLGAKWILGAIWNSQETFLKIREILEIFLGNTGTQTSLMGPHSLSIRAIQWLFYYATSQRPNRQFSRSSFARSSLIRNFVLETPHVLPRLLWNQSK